METVKRIKNLESATILLIQETKMNASDSRNLMCRLWLKGEGIAISVGGIQKWWDKTSFKCISHSENKNWLLVELEDLDKKEKFWVGNIYGPTIHGEKGEFWDSLETQMEWKREKYCMIAGDFNSMISTK